jgi:hypothetical protein
MGDGMTPLERLYGSRFNRHDQQHVEINFNYDLSPATTQEDGRARFRVDAFFFLPTNLGISAERYGKDDFFRDVLSHLRFRTPTLTSEALTDPLNPRSPLNQLIFILGRLADGAATEPVVAETAINEAKLFGCILLSNWRDARQAARDAATDLAERGASDHEVTEALRGVGNALETDHALLLRFREVRRKWALAPDAVPTKVVEAMRLVDEYLTYRFDEHVSKLHAAISELPVGIEPIVGYLDRLARQEAAYREAEGFTRLDVTRPDTLERYSYRTSALKKYLSQVLYLDVRVIREQRRFRGIIAALGAGLAAFWSTLGDRNVNFRLHNVSTAVLIGVIVLVYILKDQLKDLFKIYLTNQVQRLLPDQRLAISDPVKHMPIGECRQSVRYTEKGKLPEDIRFVREFSHAIDLDEERNEEVLSYHHTMTLEARQIQQTHQRRMNVKHILRYSVANLLGQLSDPHIQVARFNPETGVFEEVRAPKVYHLNLVFRVGMLGPAGQIEHPVYHRLRVVISKRGIERIEPVAQNQQLADLKAGPREGLAHVTPLSPTEELEDLSPS